MMSVEQGAKQKRIRRHFQHAILATVGVAGVLAVALVAPGIARLTRRPSISSKFRYRTASTLTRLKERGEIEFIERGGKTFVRLTEAGERALALLEAREKVLVGKERRWDGRYRLVIFDIPERRKAVRDTLRRQMQGFGFLRVQDSAWLYPYDCEELMALLKAELRIGKDVLYAVVEDIEYDAWIRKHFKLPPR